MDALTEITTLGIDRYTLLLILYLPIVVTIVAMWRHIIGAKVLSLYAPIVLTYALLQIGLRSTGGESIDVLAGFKYGFTLFIVVFITSTMIYSLIKPLRLHYFPKLAIVFTGVAAAMLTVLSLAAYFERRGIIEIDILSLVLIGAVSERLVTMYARYNFKKVLQTVIETMALTAICVLLISWTDFQVLLLENPWMLFVVVIINLLVGRFRGLRLTEYWRFRSILFADPEQGNDKK